MQKNEQEIVGNSPNDMIRMAVSGGADLEKLEKLLAIQERWEANEAKKLIAQFFIDKKRYFKLSTYANGTLTIGKIKSILSEWKKTDDFVPDVIIVDYADLLEDSTTSDFRHKQNLIWKGLRSLSQEQNSLVLTATQADADSYSKDLLDLKNFSEDKRKYAHVTAFYGLNQDHKGREKKMGLIRVNELLVREGDFDSKTTITILQNLRIGRPFLGSYW